MGPQVRPHIQIAAFVSRQLRLDTDSRVGRAGSNTPSLIQRDVREPTGLCLLFSAGTVLCRPRPRLAWAVERASSERPPIPARSARPACGSRFAPSSTPGIRSSLPVASLSKNPAIQRICRLRHWSSSLASPVRRRVVHRIVNRASPLTASRARTPWDRRAEATSVSRAQVVR
jgi:hypothetical protein